LKLLIYGLNFFPELTGIGKYTGEMAAWLAGRGHDVRVITAPPYYPDWKIGRGYSAWRYTQETMAGVTVYRCPLWVPAKPSGAARIAHLASFALSSLPVLLRHMSFKPDVLWTVAPAFFCAPAALAFSRFRGCPCWLHIQDYELDAAFGLGLLKGKWLQDMAGAAERLLLRRFDHVSSISERMLDVAKGKGVSSAKIVFFPNWVDVEAIRPMDMPSPMRAELGISPRRIVALYSGNMGTKQGLSILSGATRICAERGADIDFVFCGNGAGRAGLEKACAGLGNVRFLDLQTEDRLNHLLGMADIHLLPQLADATDLVMPSKLTGMLASGRPVVANGGANTELAAVTRGCGMAAQPGSAPAFAQAIIELAADQALRDALGQSARIYAETNLAKDAVLTKFENQLVHLAR